MQLRGGYGYAITQAFADARFVGLIADSMPALRPALFSDLGLSLALLSSSDGGVDQSPDHHGHATVPSAVMQHRHGPPGLAGSRSAGG
jgi:hypothetical protein